MTPRFSPAEARRILNRHATRNGSTGDGSTGRAYSEAEAAALLRFIELVLDTLDSPQDECPPQRRAA